MPPRATHVRQTRVIRERLYAGARGDGRAGLVECDVAVRPNAPQEQLNAAAVHYFLLVTVALCLQVIGVAVEEVHIGRAVE